MPDSNQKAIITHKNGPLWVVAGPGSGKTETLVLRTLKLLFVDRVNPKAILITTFTKKAAKSMFDRILSYATYLYATDPSLERDIDLHDLRIGTLHSLCNEIMLEFKYEKYENYRLLEDLEQLLFIYEHSDLVKSKNKYDTIWNELNYLANRRAGQYLTKWSKAKGATMLFNRITEDMVDLEKMRKAGGIWSLIYNAYLDYKKNLEDHGRCDYANLQAKFIEFLDSSFSKWFINPDKPDLEYPGLKYIMVDEYQDTNPIQEAIYMKLAAKTHNLVVVGDDDQALYRFRGGTVECMVTFDRACKRYWGIDLDKKRSMKYLNINYRSHPNIVEYYDDYIKSFSVMRLKDARVEGKLNLNAKSNINGDHPAVAYITGKNTEDTAIKFARFVRQLLDNGVINKPSECALLMRSVRETVPNAKYFAQHLRLVGIEPYNPRSRKFLEQEEVKLLMGAFISVIDPKKHVLNELMGDRIKIIVNGWINTYEQRKNEFPELMKYVNESVKALSKKAPEEKLKINILDVFYRIRSCEPFTSWSNDPERTYRLSQLSNIFERYSSIPYKTPGTTRGELRMSSQSVCRGEISYKWRQDFYYSLVGLMANDGLNDPEDEEVITPEDRLPIMTVHQAKGLEFPFVFVYGLNKNVRDSSIDTSILLEEAIQRFRKIAPEMKLFKVEDKEMQDIIRFYYVAYSRAMYTLIHLVPANNFKNGGIGFIGNDVGIFTKKARELRGI